MGRVTDMLAKGWNDTLGVDVESKESKEEEEKIDDTVYIGLDPVFVELIRQEQEKQKKREAEHKARLKANDEARKRAWNKKSAQLNPMAHIVIDEEEATRSKANQDGGGSQGKSNPVQENNSYTVVVDPRLVKAADNVKRKDQVEQGTRKNGRDL